MAARFGMKIDVEGIFVYKVVPGGPLDQADISRGDIILSINGTRVKDFTVLQNVLDSCQVGESVSITYMRGQSEQTATVVLQASPENEES